MKNKLHKLLYSVLSLPLIVNAQSLVVESKTAPITQNEINAFKSYAINKINPSTATVLGNEWIFGTPGNAIEACGLMYEATGDVEILDRMIQYCDIALSQRNDLAPALKGGQLTFWTGKVEPTWDSDPDEPGFSSGVAQGYIVAHMAFCAKLILKNPAIWNQPVAIGDSYSYGSTYKQRALKYIQEGDYFMDEFIFPNFILWEDNNKIWFPGAPNPYQPNSAAPWNQAFFLQDGLIRLTECHLLLNDDPLRVTQYDEIVQPNLDWFMSSLQNNTSSVGTPAYIWQYKFGAHTEDANHFAYDAEGVWIAYNNGRYGLKFKDIVPMANTYTDVILSIVQPNGKFAGKVDGTTGSGNSGGDTYVRDGYFYLADFRPDKFETMVDINIADGKIASYFPGVARLLWQKQRRYQASLNNGTALPEEPLLMYPADGAITFEDEMTINWAGSINSNSFKIYLGTDRNDLDLLDEVQGYNYSLTNLNLDETYYWKIEAINNAGSVSSETLEFKTRLQSSISTNRITGNGGTITAQYPGNVTKGEDETKLIDLNTGTKYFIGQKILWLKYESTVPAIVEAYKIASANALPERDPKAWQLEGSVNGLDWFIIDSRSDETFTARYQEKEYIVGNTHTACKFFRLSIIQNNGAAQTQLSEWNLYGEEQVLPVELLHFQGKQELNSIKLNWTTASEKNNSHYELLWKSNEDSNFKLLTSIGGKGNTDDLTHYSYLHTSPTGGTNYYQLKQIDFDGRSQEYKIISVKADFQKMTFNIIQVSETSAAAVMDSDTNETGILSIFDLNGKKIAEVDLMISKGNNRVTIPANLSSGMYVARLQMANSLVSRKFIMSF